MGWVTMVTTSLISLRAGAFPESLCKDKPVFEVTHNCSCPEQEASVTKRGLEEGTCRLHSSTTA